MMSASTRAVVTAAACALLAGAVVIAPNSIVPALLVSGGIIVFALGWPRLLGVPPQNGASVVIAGAGIAAVIAAAAVSRMIFIALVLAGGIIAAFIHQMLRKDGRPRLVESLAASVSGVAVVCAASGWIALLGREDQPHAGDFPSPLVLTLLATCTLAAASLLAASLPNTLAMWLAIVAPAILGGALGLAFHTIHPAAGVILGVALGILVSALDQLFNLFPSSGRVRPALAAALLPVLGAGIVIYTVARVVATLKI